MSSQPRKARRHPAARSNTPTPRAPRKTARKASAGRGAGGTREKLERLGIHRGFDLVLHLPLRYDDETRLQAIRDAPHGLPALVEGVITESSIKFRPRRQLVCALEDGSGTLVMRLLNFYPSQQKQLVPGARVRLFGEIRQGFFGAEMVHPRYRVLREPAPIAQTLTPFYPTTEGLGQGVLRGLILRALESHALDETLPAALLARHGLADFAASLKLLHAPPPEVDAEALQQRRHPAWRRVKFDELLAQQLSMHLHRERRAGAAAPALTGTEKLTKALLAALPFKLTPAQQRAWREISADLARGHPMRRLLQGDVGSGKTVVAALAALQCVEMGYQVAIMAPTEILAEQHYRKLSGWLSALSGAAGGVAVDWIAGALSAKHKREALARVASGETPVAIGTHALFQDGVEFKKLGLVVIDEQHRFGVRQRLALGRKGARGAQESHQLMMSATPIPRTLAMSYYADLDVSVIDGVPPGRTPVATRLVADSRREEVIRRVRDACLQGGQAYWVCPLIEEREPGEGEGKTRPLSPRRAEALQLQTALDTYQHLSETFPELRVGLVHGRMKPAEKAAAMAAFQGNQTQLLVATTVIEVGVDVPNASLMVIEHAERMGLAQLHQLRGRVGRGSAASTCILLYSAPLSAAARERLRVIFESSDGFEIARADLALRGPGEILGARQSGVPLLRYADPVADLDLIELARDAAVQLLAGNRAAAERHLERWLGGRYDYLQV